MNQVSSYEKMAALPHVRPAVAPPGPPLLHEPELFPENGRSLPGSELAWQSRWFAGHFGREFITVRGEPVRIIQFGWWNHGAGPDFRDCAVEIAGIPRHGSIELDLDARDWEAHGHAANPAYNDVILHLYLHDSGPGEWFTRTSSHREIPAVQLDVTGLPAHAVPVPRAHPGRCVTALRTLSETSWLSLLREAAIFRLQRKARQWHQAAAVHGEDQAWWQGLATALGYSRNPLPMTVLSQRLPLRWLQKRPLEAEALLFGAAGFLNGSGSGPDSHQSRQYARTLWETWWRYRAAFAPGEPHAPITWNLTGTRPANHPQRRIAALAALASAWRRIRPLLNPAAFDGRSLSETLTSLQHPFWSHHYTLNSAPAAKPIAILGASRATEIMANVCYPVLLRAKPDLWNDYARLPATAPSEALRRATIRLLGNEDAAAGRITRLWHQQAILQIYDDFCRRDSTDCAACPFPEQSATFAEAPATPAASD
jgi:hypothetical protein